MPDQEHDEEDEPSANAAQTDASAEIGGEPDATSGVIASTRTSRAWIRVLPALVVLVVILVFVLQNPKDVRVSLFTISGTLPLSVALIGAIILGALMVLALGSVRILQLRRQVRRNKKKPEKR